MTSLALLCLALGSAPQDPDPHLGEQVVRVTTTPIRKKPKAFSPQVGELKYGTVIKVTAVENKFCLFTHEQHGPVYVHVTALDPKEKFRPVASDEKQAGELRAQGHETTKGAGERQFTKEVEDQRRRDGNESLKKGYSQVDTLESTPAFKSTRTALEEQLLRFQKEGKLGDPSNVK